MLKIFTLTGPPAHVLAGMGHPRRGLALSLVCLLGLLAACSDNKATNQDHDGMSLSDGIFDLQPGPDLEADSGDPEPVVDLRGDSNRDGVVDLDDQADDENEDTWDETHGAIFLANIDDEQQGCPQPSNRISDDDLAACNDAADEVINGPEDLADLARLKIAPWPDAPDGSTARISLTLPQRATNATAEDYVRIFKGSDETATVLEPGAELSAEDLRSGVDLLVEGRDVVRDDDVWDGYVLVTLEVTYEEAGQEQTLQDQVMMRLAPLLTNHNLQPVDQVYATSLSDSDAAVLRDGLQTAMQDSGHVGTVQPIGIYDQWTQDFFETAWMSMPAQGGQHEILVYLRSANVDDSSDPVMPLRYAGRELFTLRGADVAVVQQYQLNHSYEMESLNSLGNLETVPPYTMAGGESYPMGRIIMGSVRSFFPDPTFTRLLESQKLQPPIWVDTSWLLVGHVDETMSFVKAANTRGWMLVLNDPDMARQLLQNASDQGHGDAVMFQGKYWLSDWNDPYSAEVTIDEVLADTEVMAESASAAVEIQGQLEILEQKVGITEEEIIRIPYLHYPVYDLSVAYQPGTVNGVVLGDHDFVAPDPHGPVIDGVDIFKQQMIDAFAAQGITVHFVEDWDLYHRLLGEVHCGSNVRRTRPTATNWWESGR